MDLMVKIGLLRPAGNDAEFFSSKKTGTKLLPRLGFFKEGVRVKDVKLDKYPPTAVDIIKRQLSGYNRGVSKSGAGMCLIWVLLYVLCINIITCV